MKTRRILSLALVLVMALALLSTAALAAESAAPAQYEASVNGTSVSFPAYEADGQVYVRLRDVASTLNSFNVEWVNGGIVITTGTSYASPVGNEMAVPFSDEQPYGATPASITVNGASADLSGILLTDAVGNGYSYFTPKALETTLGISLSAPAPWVAAYTQQVQALEAEDAGLTYALIYVDEDDIPELVADKNGYYVKLFTCVDGQAKEVFDLGYGIAGNAGYDYLPHGNTLYGGSSAYGGAIRYEYLFKIGAEGKLENIYDEELSIWYFDDLNGNGQYDEGEENPDTVIYRYGDQAITAEQYDSYTIEGTYETIQGSMSADEVLAALA